MQRALSAKIFPVISRFLSTGLLLGVFTLPALAQNNPVPLINQPLVPDAVAPGGPAFTLTVNGTGFVASSVVHWNGSARTTPFVSGSRVTASILASDIASAGTASVTVVNPTPGGGTSNKVFLSIATSTTSVGFLPASSFATGSQPYSVAVGDFNGDGKLDLAVANYQGSTVSVLLGDGAGNFTLASSPTVGGEPTSVAVGDFNGDGKLDLAVSNEMSSTVSILLGDGTGNFSLASSPDTGLYPFSVAVGDFNGDGNLDLAVTNCAGSGCIVAGTVSVLLGDGTGNFTLASSPATGEGPFSVAVGDFNGDGKLDLAVANANSNTLSILLGDGTGNFSLASSPATGLAPNSVAVGDFNGDGKLDLVVANANSNTLSILLGDGTGNFSLASSPAAGTLPISVAVGDFNGDGKLDLAVGNDLSATASVLLGDGTGNFTLASSPTTGVEGRSVAVGDFNGDGKLDMAVASTTTNAVLVLVQASAVTLSPGTLTFSNQTVGTTSAPQAATVTNVGYATVNISGITISGTDPGDFAETNNCGPSLAVAASCTITITFSPVTGGTRTAAVSVADDGGNNPQMISLTGTGLAVKLSANKLNFGKLMVGKISQPQTVVLTNLGSTTLTITKITVTGADNGDFSAGNTCHGSVHAGGTCSIIVRFIPTKTGLRTATVDITDNGGGSPQTIKLSGTGT